jgi:DNA replication protein DnaC
MTAIQRLKDKRTDLRLQGLLHQLDTPLEQAAQKNLNGVTTLTLLADSAQEPRWHNAIPLRWRQAALKAKCTIAQFAFDHHKSRKEQKTRMLNLRNLDCVSTHSEVMRIGNPGTGQTFLAQCLAYAACHANIKGLFPTAIDMINQLIAAEADHSLLSKLHDDYAPDLRVCDELGYLSLGQQGSPLFFQVISQRQQQTSPVMTPNWPFAEWGKVFDSPTVATAIADRLVHNSEVLILGGSSDRRKLP